jgi:hypothetical protein
MRLTRAAMLVFARCNVFSRGSGQVSFIGRLLADRIVMAYDLGSK